jgi:hypothetical protein
MATRFSVLEARLNEAVFSRLSNVETTLAGVTVRGIFDKEYLLEDLGGGIATSGPVFTLASADVPAIVAGLALVVNGLTYKVVEPMPDGAGVTVLRLRT